MEHTLTTRITMMLERMETYYGPNRIRRMSKDEINKMSMLYGVSLEERDESYKILEEVVTNKEKI